MDIYLLIVTLIAIAIVILGVSWWKWHAFISLTVASLFLAIMSGLNLTKIVTAYETGVGRVLEHLVGILALGTILGKIMSDSGAGMQVADFFIRFFGVKKLPWAMLFASPSAPLIRCSIWLRTNLEPIADTRNSGSHLDTFTRSRNDLSEI